MEAHSALAPDSLRAAPAVGTRDLLRLAGPIFIAQLAVMGLGVIDTIMAGRLSALDLAAVAVGGAIYISVFIGLMGVLQALTPIAGHHFGAGRWREIGVDLGQALWLAGAMSALGMPLLILNTPWLRWAGADEPMAGIASRYLIAVALGLPAALIARAYIALNSAVSRPNVVMVINVAALGAKVPLNYLFMYGGGGLPALGGAGCGVATAVLMWATAAANWAVWRFDPFYQRFRAPPGALRRPLWPRQRELLALGLPAGGSLLIEVTSFTFIALLLVRLGAVTVAGHQIVVNLISVLYMVPLGLGLATSVLVAQALGAGHPVVARRAALRGYRITLGIALLAAALLVALREPIVAAYTRDAEVAAVALSLIAVAAGFHAFDAMQGVAGFILRGYKVAFVPMLIHGASLWGIGLLGGYWLAYHPPAGWPLGGALSFWTAAACGLVVAGGSLTLLATAVARRHVRAARG
jgi:MATE family multidrug resistance protein